MLVKGEGALRRGYQADDEERYDACGTSQHANRIKNKKTLEGCFISQANEKTFSHGHLVAQAL